MAGVYGIEETGDIQRLMEFMPAISCQEDFAWLERVWRVSICA